MAHDTRSAQKCSWILRNIDAEAFARHGVQVTVQRRRVNVSLAEEAFALLSGMGKQLFELNKVIDEARLARAGYRIRPYDKRYTGGSNFARIPGLKVLQGATLAIIGFGEAGRELGKRAAAFEMRILYHQRTPLAAAEENVYGARYAALDDLLRASDYISVNLPVTPQTTGIIGRDLGRALSAHRRLREPQFRRVSERRFRSPASRRCQDWP